MSVGSHSRWRTPQFYKVAYRALVVTQTSSDLSMPGMGPRSELARILLGGSSCMKCSFSGIDIGMGSTGPASPPFNL